MIKEGIEASSDGRDNIEDDLLGEAGPANDSREGVEDDL